MSEALKFYINDVKEFDAFLALDIKNKENFQKVEPVKLLHNFDDIKMKLHVLFKELKNR